MSSKPVQGKGPLSEQRQIRLDPIQWALQENNLDWYRELVEYSRDLLCIHDLQGRLLSVNPVPARLLGYSVEEMLQIPMREMIVPEYRNEFDLYLKQIERDGEAHGLMIVVGRSGERRIWEFHNTLRTTGVAAPIVLGLAHDITEKRQAEAKFQELLEAAPDAMVVVDAEARIMLVNAQVEGMFGYPREELLGQRIEMLVPERLRERYGELRSDFLRAPYDMPMRNEREFLGLHKDGHEFAVEINLNPLQTVEGLLVTSAIRDITQRKRAEQDLRASEERLRLAQEVAKIGTFERNLQTGESRWTPEMEAMYGLPPGGFPRSVEAFLELVHGEDRPHVARRIEQSNNTGDAEGEWRVVWPDGTVHWIAGRWRVFKDEHGRPLRVLGVDFDISDRKGTEEALRTSEERLRIALKSAPIKVFNQDRDLRYTWAHNLSGGWAEGDFLGKTDEEIFEPETAARMRTLKQSVLETGNGKREVMTLTGHGEISHCDITAEPLRDAAGRAVGVSSACMDVTQLQQMAEDLRQAKEKLAEEKFYLEQEIDTELGFKEIVGKSAALKEVMEQVGKVAASDANVLLLGETGTGKELVARALHRLSRRAGNSFIKMNCAAIPSGLLESELFGYEKGAFTGAVSKKLGRLELADKGTLFLDEIGEVPLSLQPKLLRVLQDQEFERLGGTQTLKVDFRLIAATNRDLAESVRKNEFRSDLYYRLNVFPVRVPPLRERREDVRLLVEHFVQKCAMRMNKKITSIPKKTIDALMQWNWPGNVRELENFVERSVILTHGSVLVAPLSELKSASEIALNDTLEAAEREHILRALRESHGQIGGPRGAAARLGLKRTTLQSKLKQMRIARRPPAAGH
ncbi:MAG: sigma 54-interacting transcriptional regulator [Acidobacteriia bacterium]|nr:sigma 54-interacting transcriptional regulator [Terriglobia bacterium]